MSGKRFMRLSLRKLRGATSRQRSDGLEIGHVALQYWLYHLPRLDTARFHGALQVLSRLPQSTTHIVAKSESPVPSDCGLGLVPTHTFANCPSLDLLCVPGRKLRCRPGNR